MPTALFVTTTDVKRFTVIDGNVDNDKFIQFIEIAQSIHIQNVLGTDLFEKLQSDIAASTLTGAYETLVETWIKPSLIWYAFYEYLTWAGITVGNKGVYRHTSEAAVVVDPDELEILKNKAKNLADYYLHRLVDYLRANTSSFPEYDTNQDGDVYPDQGPSTGNWYLGFTRNEKYKDFLD
jgi:hypothetical protein